MEWEVSLIFDIETNGLLHDVSTIHCLAIHDLSTDQTIAYNDTGSSEPISRGLQRLQDRTGLLVTTLLVTTYLLSVNSTLGLATLLMWWILYT